MFNPQLINKAIKFAQEKHKGQTRKVSGCEYITHPLEVSYIVAHFKQSKNLDILIAASILHDTVEDTDTTFEELLKEFGMQIATLVFELTDDPVKKASLGKLEYQKAKWRGLSSYAMYLKLCDRLSNMTDSPSDKAKQDTKKLLTYIRKYRKLSKSQVAVINEIQKHL